MQPKDITVTLHGREYRIRSPFEKEYTMKLAKYCDSLMKNIGSATGSTDYLGLSVLTLLQLAHNYHQQAELAQKPNASVEAEITRLINLLDQAERDAASHQGAPFVEPPPPPVHSANTL
ncbi:MAG: cell division protein ZapA [Nitrospinae bacterium]|nr:cell division protein ZapA [Nitrospinota bacterium]